MIDTSKAKWDLSTNDKAAIKWLEANGFSGVLVKQYISKSVFRVEKDGVGDTLEIPDSKDRPNMEQFGRNFERFCELQKLKEELRRA